MNDCAAKLKSQRARRKRIVRAGSAPYYHHYDRNRRPPPRESKVPAAEGFSEKRGDLGSQSVRRRSRSVLGARSEPARMVHQVETGLRLETAALQVVHRRNAERLR